MEGIIEKWKNNAQDDYKFNLEFLSTFRNQRTIDEKVAVLHQDVFQEVDCLSCANCCRTTPALVERSDAKRIAKHLGIPPKTFIRKYLLEDVTGELMINRVPCTFLKEDNTCEIYEVRPKACRQYPHTDHEGFHKRAKMNAKNTIVCPATYEIVNRLKKIENSIQ